MGVRWIFNVLVNYSVVFGLFFVKELGAGNLTFNEIDGERLITAPYGTDLFLLENSYREQKFYRFEDFFWTGSGDGDEEENAWTSPKTPISTVYRTSTLVSTSTVFIKTTGYFNESTTEKCTENCEIPANPENEINPSPTQNRSSDAGQQFWIVTILKTDGRELVIHNLTNSLAKLYKIAFQRQQEQHLGINNRLKRTPTEKPVEVFIHNVDKRKLNDTQKVEVVYHVEVAGKAIDAYTATSDISHLVTDDEVKRELGVPFIIKAEPYLKASEPMGLSRAKSTWLVIGLSILGLLVFLLVVAFLILGFTKRKRIHQNQDNQGIENKKHIFERGVGYENKGLVQDEADGKQDSPTYINFQTKQTDNIPVVVRPESSISISSSSSSSLDISPLMSLGKKRRATPKKPTRPRAALNKTVPLNVSKKALRKDFHPEIFDSDSSSSRRDTPDAGFTEYEHGVLSSKSYLSMPSVKSFPRCNIPEPLNKVLEPVSMTHLDMPDDDQGCSSYSKYSPDMFMRHGSVGTVQDPGVIGPVVWSMHCERLKHGSSMDEGMNDIKTSNVSKMRKRFHDILDDTFSLFGSRRSTPAHTPGHQRSRSIAIEVKSHSAIENRANQDSTPVPRPRPKTTDTKTSLTSPGPRGAWSSTAPSPLIRPLSAGIVMPGSSTVRKQSSQGSINTLQRQSSGPRDLQGIPSAPRVNVEHILAEGKFRPSDPAISVIAAIKSEIERVSLPGSTTDLTK